VSDADDPRVRAYKVWHGAALLTSFGDFNSLWMTKAEYEEHGAYFIHRKAMTA